GVDNLPLHDALPILSTQKKEGATADGPQIERVIEHVIVQEPVRQKLPKKRASKTFSFRVADCHGYVTVGEFEDGRPGELFLRVADRKSTRLNSSHQI